MGYSGEVWKGAAKRLTTGRIRARAAASLLMRAWSDNFSSVFKWQPRGRGFGMNSEATGSALIAS